MTSTASNVAALAVSFLQLLRNVDNVVKDVKWCTACYSEPQHYISKLTDMLASEVFFGNKMLKKSNIFTADYQTSATSLPKDCIDELKATVHWALAS
uniref:Uncharacterized protein n=1 Tax=Romanomermis culicivorax TaxID=13658 RepID=A0A915JSN3_ROMCU